MKMGVVMNNDHDFEPGFWRNASRPIDIYGIPAPLFFLYLFWFRFPCLGTIYIVTGIILFFRVLSYFGWNLKKISARGLYLVRGNNLSGRPWWYRRFKGED